jgi:hypothetical protein
VTKDVDIGSTLVIVVDALMLTTEEVIVFTKVVVLLVTVLGMLTMDLMSPRDEFRDEGTANFGVFGVDMINPPPTEFVDCNMVEELLEAIVDPRISA